MAHSAWKLGAVAMLAAFALAAPAQNAGAGDSTVRAADALERALLGEVNQFRARQGLRPLRLSAPLSAAADAHTRSMVAQGFFSHTSSDGTSFSKRVERWYRPRGYAYWSVGENLLWASPTVAPADALAMWLESPPHRRILLAPRWREIGLSAVEATSAPGVFDGLDVVVITADFGVRR